MSIGTWSPQFVASVVIPGLTRITSSMCQNHTHHTLHTTHHTSHTSEFRSVFLHWIPEKPHGGLMLERWVQWVWLGKRFTTDEDVIGLENGKVVRMRNVRPKSMEDTWNMEEIDKIQGQPWD